MIYITLDENMRDHLPKAAPHLTEEALPVSTSPRSDKDAARRLIVHVHIHSGASDVPDHVLNLLWGLALSNCNLTRALGDLASRLPQIHIVHCSPPHTVGDGPYDAHQNSYGHIGPTNRAKAK